MKTKRKKILSLSFLSFITLVTLVFFLTITKVIRIDIVASSVNQKSPYNYLILNTNSSITNDKKSFLLFISTWCSSCDDLTNKIKNIAFKYNDITFYEVNLEENMNLANNYKVSSAPTVVLQGKTQSFAIEEANLNTIENLAAKLSSM